ncbi:MAG: hypothetical protein ABIH99_04465 [Candidatus Micrarchaeota archaeon]
MEYNYSNKNIFEMDLTYARVFILLALCLAPNILGMINYTADFGFKIHTFQLAIFLVALSFGPIGGALAGAFGSVFSAVATSNPYLLIGNVILGFAFGVLARMGWKVWKAVLAAYFIQLLWLIPSDLYLAHMPANVLTLLVISLLISDMIWAVVAKWIHGNLQTKHIL